MQHATKEELKVFRNTNVIYDIAALKPLGWLVSDVAMQEEKNIQSCEEQNYCGNMEFPKNHEQRKVQLRER